MSRILRNSPGGTRNRKINIIQSLGLRIRLSQPLGSIRSRSRAYNWLIVHFSFNSNHIMTFHRRMAHRITGGLNLTRAKGNREEKYSGTKGGQNYIEPTKYVIIYLNSHKHCTAGVFKLSMQAINR